MHTLYRWEFSKIKNNMLTPMNAITEEEMMPKPGLTKQDVEKEIKYHYEMLKHADLVNASLSLKQNIQSHIRGLEWVVEHWETGVTGDT